MSSRFPAGPSTIPRYENIKRSRHMGVEVGGEVLLVEDILRGWGLARPPIGCGCAPAIPGRVSRSSIDPTFNNNDLPGAPRALHRVRAALRAWLGLLGRAQHGERAPRPTSSTARTPIARPRTCSATFAMGYDYKPWNLSVFFRGPQPDRQAVHLGGGGRRRERQLLRPRGRPRLLRRPGREVEVSRGQSRGQP